MSYEGYEVWLCSNGHRHTFDCYQTPDWKEWACPHCGTPVAWMESVDETNCEPRPTRLTVDHPAVTKRCEHCGVTTELAPVEYKIPRKRKP